LGDTQFDLRQSPAQFILAHNGFAGDQFKYLPLPESFLARQSLTCRALCTPLHNYARLSDACQLKK
jgi:hypothetical protein